MKRMQKGTATVPTSPEQITQVYEADKAHIDRLLNENTEKVVAFRLSLKSTSKELFGGKELYSVKPRYVAHFFWLLALVVVAGIEIPTNSGGFEIFNRSQLQTTSMAVAFGFMLALFSHYTGFSLKRGIVERKHGVNHWQTSMIIAAVLCGVTFVMLWCITEFRVMYMHKMGYKDSINQLTQTAFTFVIFLGGAFASYQHTSAAKDLELEKRFKADVKDLQKLEATSKKLANEKSRLAREYAVDFPAAERAMQAYQKQLQQVQQQLQEQEAQLQNKEEEQNKLLQQQQQAKKDEFNDYLTQAKEFHKQAKAIYANLQDKSTLLSNVPFVTAKQELNDCIENMKEMEGIENAQASIEEAEGLIAELNGLSNS